jgi:hypothetical protein
MRACASSSAARVSTSSVLRPRVSASGATRCGVHGTCRERRVQGRERVPNHGRKGLAHGVAGDVARGRRGRARARGPPPENSRK